MSEAVAGAATNAAWTAGGYKDEDEHFANQLFEAVDMGGGVWKPPCWGKSPEELASEAKSMNERAFDIAVANGGKHSHG